MSEKKSSSDVRLAWVTVGAMIGGMGLLALVSQRNKSGEYPLYLSREDCVREWGDRDCEPDHSATYRGYWRGPSGAYDLDQTGKAHPSSRGFTHVPEGSKSVGIARGGFGSTGMHYGAGS